MAVNYELLMDNIKAIVDKQAETREVMRKLVRTITAEKVLPCSTDTYNKALEDAYYRTGLGFATPRIAHRERRMRLENKT